MLLVLALGNSAFYIQSMPGYEGLDENPDFKSQQRLQENAFASLESGDSVTAADCINQAAAYSSQLLSNGNQVWAVESSISLNESLHSTLENLVSNGEISTAEALAAERARTTANPYEAVGIYYWIGMHEAQKGKLRVAEEQAKLSEDLAENIGSHWLAAQAENLLSRIYDDLGEDAKARGVLTKALDNIEAGQESELYWPEEYKLKTAYGVKHRLRFFLGQRLYYDREREARDFCSEVLTATSNPSRRGFLHWWMGQAETMHTKPIKPDSTHRDVTRAALRLKAAEDYFVAADEPIFAGMVVIDQGELGEMPRALGRAEKYIQAAIVQYETHGNAELGMEIEGLVQQFRNARMRTSASHALLTTINSSTGNLNS